MDVGISLNRAVQSGLPRGLEEPKANTKSGPTIQNVQGWSGGTLPRKFTCSEVWYGV